MADDHRSRKFHEGWLHIKVKGDWTRYWAVLRGQTIYFFQSDKTTEQNHVGTLYLDGQTEVKNLAPEGLRKKTYKLELYTHHPVRKCNRFKFDKENNRDVWKCFILGVSTGLVPRDVKILPGQLKDVVEAIGEMMRTPPPLPSLPRPRTNKNVQDFNRQMSSKGSERSWASNGSEESDGSGSFGTHITPHDRSRSKSVPRIAAVEDVPNLRTLYRRQSELALKSLGRERARSPGPASPPSVGGRNHHQKPPTNNHVPGPGGERPRGDSSGSDDYGSESSIQWSEFSIGSPPPKSTPGAARGQHVTKFSELDNLEWGGESLMSWVSGNPASPAPVPPPLTPNCAYPRPTSPVMMASQRPSSPPPPPSSYPASTGRHGEIGGGGLERKKSINAPPAHQSSDYGSTSSEVHLFYMESGRNRDHPPWFFENTSRELAESILTLGKRYGNVLMRESVTFKNTGSYVISMRREVAGYDPRSGQHFSRGTQLNHYEVQKTQHGFKINVDNDHRPMRCLNDVMEFFVGQAGPGSSPLRTNNLGKLGLNVSAHASRRDSDSGMEDDDAHSSQSLPSVATQHPGLPRANTRPNPGKMHMKVSGNVPNEMSAVAMDIEYTMKKTTPKWDQSRMSMPPVPPPPPPPPSSIGGPPPPSPKGGAPHLDYTNTARYGDYDARSRGTVPPQDGGFSDPNLNRTVPPRLPPTETMQRAAGHHDTYYNQHRERKQSSHDYGPDPFDSPSSVVGPPAPPPPPMMDTSSPPPPPPPAAESAPPAASSFPSMIQQGALNAARRTSESSNNPPPSPGFQATPGGRRGPGPAGGGAALSFEDELKKRLVSQREDVYASGATILRSGNWT